MILNCQSFVVSDDIIIIIITNVIIIIVIINYILLLLPPSLIRKLNTIFMTMQIIRVKQSIKRNIYPFDLKVNSNARDVNSCTFIQFLICPSLSLLLILFNSSSPSFYSSSCLLFLPLCVFPIYLPPSLRLFLSLSLLSFIVSLLPSPGFFSLLTHLHSPLYSFPLVSPFSLSLSFLPLFPILPNPSLYPILSTIKLKRMNKKTVK